MIYDDNITDDGIFNIFDYLNERKLKSMRYGMSKMEETGE
jgi:hypothetical protein